ncbi:MAG: hypothetical protein BroJett011_11680 [Chloroflexota bacterium]|nr:MAG: hypothetical protein BroJett011_11680 [Chloroflexota bacterium]
MQSFIKTLLNGQQAILARTAAGRPYFAVFIYSESEAVNLIHVIAGRKLNAITDCVSSLSQM